MTPTQQNTAPTHGKGGSAGGGHSSSHRPLPARKFTSHGAEIAAVLAEIETERQARELDQLRRRAEFEMECV